MRVQELIDLVSEIENKQLKNYSSENNRYDIAPVNSEGSPASDASARPTIAFKVFDDEIALQWLYLNTRNQGLGTKIIQWLIDYCKVKGISKMSIRLVEEDNKSMMTLAEKFGFQIRRKRGSSLNYELIL
ncbi:GNAT family N-acetyltransferase [Clostridium botulinum]|nr:GNAT family N-acetyltransferase [Clostridium botulinum]NFF10925.1 GNAT family N-acetyltransferase [Clostridium botulinum]